VGPLNDWSGVMTGFDGSLARKLDFGEQPTVITSTGARGRGLRLAPSVGKLTGPDKYRMLDIRRRRAQIAARRMLALFDAAGS
jgi:hypothetical protein